MFKHEFYRENTTFYIKIYLLLFDQYSGRPSNYA